MAKAVINLQKESGGITKISSADGTGVTELVVPESGSLVSVDTAVTDNAIAKYDGTTGKLQDSGVVIDDNDRLIIGKLNIAPILLFNRGTDGLSLGYLGNASNSGVDLNLINSSGAGNLNLGAGINADVNIVSGNLLLKSATGALGYGTGAGGTVTQLTSKSTPVTLNKPCGVITTHNSALAAGASVTIVLYNALVSASDTSIATSTNGNYEAHAYVTSTGVIYIRLTNVSGSSLSQAVSISFSVVRGSNA